MHCKQLELTGHACHKCIEQSHKYLRTPAKVIYDDDPQPREVHDIDKEYYEVVGSILAA